MSHRPRHMVRAERIGDASPPAPHYSPQRKRKWLQVCLKGEMREKIEVFVVLDLGGRRKEETDVGHQ